jgi:hypothetical protein
MRTATSRCGSPASFPASSWPAGARCRCHRDRRPAATLGHARGGTRRFPPRGAPQLPQPRRAASERAARAEASRCPRASAPRRSAQPPPGELLARAVEAVKQALHRARTLRIALDVLARARRARPTGARPVEMDRPRRPQRTAARISADRAGNRARYSERSCLRRSRCLTYSSARPEASYSSRGRRIPPSEASMPGTARASR